MDTIDSVYIASEKKWYYAEKNVATYDEYGRQDGFYPYEWSEVVSDWVGRGAGTSSPKDALTAEYDEQGREVLTVGYSWENNGWMAYKRIESTNNDDGLLILRETKYWNRTAADWIGNDSYWGFDAQNTRLEQYYDEQNRISKAINSVFGNDGKYYPNWMGTYEYMKFETNDSSKVIVCDYYRTESGSTDLNLFQRHTYTYNKYGSECYYLSEMLMGDMGMLKLQEQDVRMDEYNRYVEGRFYRFKNTAENSRFADYMERAEYADYTSKEVAMQGIMQPWTEMWTWYGNLYDDTTWYPSRYQTWTYENDVVATEYRSYAWDGDNQNMVYGYSNGYDFNTSADDIAIWTINRTEISYKPLYHTEYESSENDFIKMVYFYSTEDPTLGISQQTPLLATKRYYDLQGRQISQPARGIYIIREADGTTKKVCVE